LDLLITLDHLIVLTFVNATTALMLPIGWQASGGGIWSTGCLSIYNYCDSFA